MKNTNCIGTTHSLARELFSRPDTFLTATDGEEEYVVESIKRIATHANLDDTITHLSLILRKCGGNLR